jgi:hypothetical protein
MFPSDAAAGLPTVQSLTRLIGTVGDIAVTHGVQRCSRAGECFLDCFWVRALGRSGFETKVTARRHVKKEDHDGLGFGKGVLGTGEGLRGGMCTV